MRRVGVDETVLWIRLWGSLGTAYGFASKNGL
jgi:hypothetical protein